MAILLPAVAFVATLIGGAGLYRLLIGDRSISIVARWGLSVLLGVLVTSISVFLASFFLHSTGIIFVGCLVNVSVALLSRLRKASKGIAKETTSESVLIAIVLLIVHAVIAIWITHHRGIGWDGLFVWDLKAHAFFVHRGHLPIEYFSDPTRRWSHQNYPLMLPMTELWAYLWVGVHDQSVGKYVPLIFYVAAVSILYGAGKELGGSTRHGVVAAALPLFIPFVIMGDGSATSGYADFPIATFYVAAIAALMRGVQISSDRWLIAGGVLAAAMPWTKQEGLILWCAFATICMIVLARCFPREGRLRLAVTTLAPGALVLLAWRVFLYCTAALNGGAFVPMTLGTAVSNVSRLVPIAGAVVKEFMGWQRWSILWLAYAIAIIHLSRKKRWSIALPLFCAVALPIPAYMLVYLFSAWNPFMKHVQTSLSRLFLQLSLPAILAIAAAMPPRLREGGAEREVR